MLRAVVVRFCLMEMRSGVCGGGDDFVSTCVAEHVLGRSLALVTLGRKKSDVFEIGGDFVATLELFSIRGGNLHLSQKNSITCQSWAALGSELGGVLNLERSIQAIQSSANLPHDCLSLSFTVSLSLPWRTLAKRETKRDKGDAGLELSRSRPKAIHKLKSANGDSPGL